VSKFGWVVVSVAWWLGVGAAFLLALSALGFGACRALRVKVRQRPVIDPSEPTGVGAFRLIGLLAVPGGALLAVSLVLAVIGLLVVAVAYYGAALF
jgi:hypothetical protein